VGVIGASKFEARAGELVESLADFAELVEPLLIVWRSLRKQIGILVAVPGRSCGGADLSGNRRRTVRFRNSKAVGAVFGLTPSKYQSGEVDRTLDIAVRRRDDAGESLRCGSYHAGRVAVRSWLKTRAKKIAKHRGMKKATVALAHSLALIMHRIPVNGTKFRWVREHPR
jgi:transposase